MIINESIAQKLRPLKLNVNVMAELHGPLSLVFNDYVLIFGNTSVSSVNIDSFSYINSNCSINLTDIGRYTSIASDVHTGLATHDIKAATQSSFTFLQGLENFPEILSEDGEDFKNINTDFANKASQNFSYLFAKECSSYSCHHTEIGHDVWIGQGVKILGKVKIGTGAVIGAGTILTRDVPPYAIVTGAMGHDSSIPFTRFRFDENTIERLIKSEWWNFNIPRAMALGFKIDLHDINSFASLIENEGDKLPRLKDNYRAIVLTGPQQLMVTHVTKDFKAWKDECRQQLFNVTPPSRQ